MMLWRRWVPLAVFFLLFLAVAGCGARSADDVVEDLEKKLNRLTSYSAAGTLVLQTGETPREYDVEVWHKNPDFYRIALTNREGNITQIILRNEEGVFVLTPHLNKSFRFQSGWPENHGQVYLFESLVRSVLEDNERSFVEEENAYVFTVKANYQNRSLASQKIWFAKKDLAPQKVQVMDTDYKVLVELAFNEFQFDVRFEDDAFEMDRNMTSYQLGDVPAVADAGGSDGEFHPIPPAYVPEGVHPGPMEEIAREDGTVYRFKYDGEYQYVVMEEPVKAKAVMLSQGEVVDLGFTVGVLSRNEDLHTLRFTHDGIDFTLLSSNLPLEEMHKVAASVFAQVGK